uniref:Uncharacterized protein n=1 Tax=Arundo donax TaxID=35708 RepID=A0A0A8XX97_ARUDO
MQHFSTGLSTTAQGREEGIKLKNGTKKNIILPKVCYHNRDY